MLTPAEILTFSLGLPENTSPARAVVEFSKLELDEAASERMYRQIAGEGAPEVPARIINTVVSYIIYDAARGSVSVDDCIARAERLAAAQPYNYTDAAVAERAAEKAQAKVAKVQAKAERQAVAATEPTVNPDGSIVRRKGRPPAGAVTAMSQALDLYREATDKSREAIVALFQSKLQLNQGTATTYYYKARKAKA